MKYINTQNYWVKAKHCTQPNLTLTLNYFIWWCKNLFAFYNIYIKHYILYSFQHLYFYFSCLQIYIYIKPNITLHKLLWRHLTIRKNNNFPMIFVNVFAQIKLAEFFFQTHVPGYLENYNAIKKKGIDEIICIAVNDAFVMDAWAKDLKTEGKVCVSHINVPMVFNKNHAHASGKHHVIPTECM